MKAEGDTIRLSTGTKFYAHGAVLGLGVDGRGLSEGWDGNVSEHTLTVRERKEIARHMIRAWTKWARPNRKRPRRGR